MNKLILALKSRTVWTLALIVVINAIPAIREAFPSAGGLETVNGILLAVAAYFKIFPSQTY